ncbi:Fic family protein [Patescibacteria group bacterium]|nr:Fic family protein [Patescibacteria group bacterium]
MSKHQLDNLPAEIWQLVAQIDELKGQWVAGLRISPQVLDRLKKSVLITSSGASTRIEGAQLSDQEVSQLIQGIDIKKFVSRDAQEVQGYYQLLVKVFDSWPSLSLTEGTIKHFHQELLKYVKKDKLHRGEYKRIDNKVRLVNAVGKVGRILFNTTPAVFTPTQMHDLVEQTRDDLAQKQSHQLLTIARFIVVFLQIHPFTDGNGRLSRILTNLLLLKAGYGFMLYVSHEKMIEDQKVDYYLALRQTQQSLGTDDEDLIPWFRFFLLVVLQQAQEAVALLKDENIVKLFSPAQLKVLEYLQQSREATAAEIAQVLRIPRPTVYQSLQKLIKFRQAISLGQGRATRYMVL